jgi:hypothetical protein
MNFPIFGAKGRTPWVLNKAEARRKGRKTWTLGRETWSVLVSEYYASLGRFTIVRTVRTCMWLAAFCWTMATSWFPKPK